MKDILRTRELANVNVHISKQVGRSFFSWTGYSFGPPPGLSIPIPFPFHHDQVEGEKNAEKWKRPDRSLLTSVHVKNVHVAKIPFSEAERIFSNAYNVNGQSTK